MSRADSDVDSSGIAVHGGAGGFSAALDDLLAAIASLRGCSDLLHEISRAARRLELLSGAITRSAPVDDLARMDWQQSEVVLDVGQLAIRLERHAWQTRQVVGAYQLADVEAAVSIAAARVAVPVLLQERWRLKALGLVQDGTAGPVEPLPLDPESVVELSDLASLVASQAMLSGGSTVRVIEQPQADGSSAWIVQVPGTIRWSPVADEVPNDLTADLQLLSMQQAALAQGVVDALAAAQQAAGRLGQRDPVMLTGHSLGGLAVAAIASDEAVRERFAITHVVTIGSPVGYVPVPEEVEVLSFEHTGDIVPGLDLAPNPDRETWTTVRREVPEIRMAFNGGGPSEHSAITYRETARLAAVAIEERSEPSLVRWAATALPFLRGAPAPASDRAGEVAPRRTAQRVRDYRVRRSR